MNKNSYDTLFKEIRAKCEREHWFGPYIGLSIRRRFVPADDPQHFGFTFPPASEEQLQATEDSLGFPLPPLLRSLYAHVANGGFGPGTGLRGVLGGYGKLGTGWYPNDDSTLVAQYLFESRKHTFDLTRLRHNDQNRINLEIPYGIWPEQLLPFCDMGCVQEACVDNQGHMFHVGTLEDDEVYWLYQLPWSFEEWLWRWIRNEDLMVRYLEPDEQSIRLALYAD